jgi:hypothetical protein
VDRNLELNPSEAYAGPIHGPPMIYRVYRDATLVFDLSPGWGKRAKDGTLLASASTRKTREDLPTVAGCTHHLLAARGSG